MKKLVKSKKKTSYGNPRQCSLEGYIAGIIDGEGCIGIHKSKSQYNSPLYRPTVCVGMVNDKIINLLHKHYGGHVYLERVPQNKNRQLVYRWKLSDSKGCQKLIRDFSGKLLEKEEQLGVLSDFLENKIENPTHKRKLSDEEIQRREGLYMKMKELNAVGQAATTKRFDNREIEAIV